MNGPPLWAARPGDAAVAELAAAGFARLAERAREFGHAAGGNVEPLPPFLLESDVSLRAMTAGAGLVEADHARLRGLLARSADPALLQAVLLRALAPRQALLTVPRESLFSASELLFLPPRAEAADLPATDLRQPPGKPVDYSGYICAILKLTRLCNLRCSYCKDWSDDAASTMPLPLLARLVAQLLAGPHRGIDLILHGGEPLMAGRRRLLQLLWLVARHIREGQVVNIHLQSNGTLIDRRWTALLRLMGIRVSVSLDGPGHLHDAVRPDALGRPSYDRAIRGIELLRQAGLLSGVLIVVSRAILDLGPQALVAFLRERRMFSVALIPERPGPGTPPVVKVGEFVDFLIGFHRAQQDGGPPVRAREIEALRNLLAGRSSGFCELAGNCVGHFITVESDGAVSHCDKYLGEPDYVLGNLSRQPLSRILQGGTVTALREQVAAESAALGACHHRHLCLGWCPHERFIRRRSAPADAGCCGLAPLFDALSHDARKEARP